MTIKIKFNSFNETINYQDTPVLVDFFANWCGPCKLMSNILITVESQLGDKLEIVKVDTDLYTDIARKYNIRSLPTLILFKKGEVIKRIEGSIKQSDELITILKDLITN